MSVQPNIFYVYILLLCNKRHYTGLTNDLDRRMAEHAYGMSKSTRNQLPFERIYVAILTTRKKARKLEVKIKRAGAQRFLNKLKYSYGEV